MRTDNEGEYTSNEFLEYFSLEEMKKEHTVPHTLQQNGVAKRKNRTLVGIATAMLFDQGLPLSYGSRHTRPQFTFKTGVPTQLWGGRHPRRSS